MAKSERLFPLELSAQSPGTTVPSRRLLETASWVFRAMGPPQRRRWLDQRAWPSNAAGNIYIADSFNHRARKVSPNGTMSTVAGNGIPSFSRDRGPATSAGLRWRVLNRTAHLQKR